MMGIDFFDFFGDNNFQRPIPIILLPTLDQGANDGQRSGGSSVKQWEHHVIPYEVLVNPSLRNP